MAYEIPEHHKSLMPNHTLEECYDLLAEATNQMSGDCDPEKCIDGYHVDDCASVSSHITIINQQAEIERLRGKNTKLRAALIRHGEHADSCASMDTMDCGMKFTRHDWPCDCGLRAALETDDD